LKECYQKEQEYWRKKPHGNYNYEDYETLIQLCNKIKYEKKFIYSTLPFNQYESKKKFKLFFKKKKIKLDI